MNYKQYIKLNEALKNYFYQIPTDKSELLFDFYMSTFLTETGNDNVDYSLKDMKERLYPYLKKELLSVVLFSITAELRHVFDKNQSNIDFDKETKSFLRKYSKELNNTNRPDKYKVFDRRRKNEIRRDLKTSNNSRKDSYIAAKKTSANKIDIVKASMDAFYNGAWSSSYGGNKWGDICDGWLKLNETKTLNEIVIWIDHVYDLQHNTDTVLNKVERYSRDGGFSWINKALEIKKYIKSPYEIFDKISPSMKKIAGFVIKENEGTTLELWSRKKSGELNEIDDEVPVKKSYNMKKDKLLINEYPHTIRKKVKSFIDSKINLNHLKEYFQRVDIDSVDEYNHTALLLAAYYRQKEVMEILLKFGANTAIKDENGQTPLDIAISSGHDEIAELLKTYSEPKKKNHVQSNFVWESGIWSDGIWKGGTWKGGTWRGGTWRDGIWKDGIWKDGTWEGGIWFGGTWRDGLWNDGTWEGGVWKDGIWKDGIWKKGIWRDGIWKGGWIYDPDKKGNYENDWEWINLSYKDYVRSPINPKEYFKNNVKNEDLIFDEIVKKLHQFNDNMISLLEVENILDKIDINIKDHDENTLLHVFSSSGKQSVVSLLLQYVVNINAKNYHGDTALHNAVYNGHDIIVKELLKAGADVNIKNNNDEQPIDIAHTNKNNTIINLLKTTHFKQNATFDEIVKKLHQFNDNKISFSEIINFLNNVDVKIEKKETLLHMFKQDNETRVTELLLKYGIPINAKNNIGDTILHKASFFNSKKLVSYLLNHKANPNVKNYSGNTPLSYAAYNGNNEIIEMLLYHGADINLKCKYDNTALDMAIQQKHPETAKLLKDKMTES